MSVTGEVRFNTAPDSFLHVDNVHYSPVPTRTGPESNRSRRVLSLRPGRVYFSAMGANHTKVAPT